MVRFSVLGVVLSSLLSTQMANAANKAAAQTNSGAPIRQEMGGLFVALSEFLPFALNKAEFENPKNSREILSLMTRMQDLSGRMVANTKKFRDKDPSIPFIAEKFDHDIRMSIELWQSGDRVIPRRLMRNVTDYCISCHTRTSKGLHLSDVIQTQRFRSLPALTKAEYLAATRQFSEALKQYEHVLVDKPLAKTDPEAWDLAVRKMLAISVRVEKNPNLTMELLSRIQDEPSSMPAALRQDIALWRQSAKAWTLEPRTPSLKDTERYSLAQRLIQEGEAISQKNPGGALIEYMRASALLHDLLGRATPAGASEQQVLWLAGKAAEYLRNLNLWTLQDTYFEGCVRKGPDKRLATQCLERFEASMLQSYGASSRAGLPGFAKQQLEELQKLTK
jgi:hypothetical protein